ncbi:MAG: molybdopterin molybdotransferase MoeA, partial [Planctomycetaceae bacterium]|nr:molybdopterin molybdotransferase MoeA [Planctomycetaceae bacterium]
PVRSDVRMSGFASRSTVADALVWIDANSTALTATESTNLEEATGRVLAKSLTAPRNVPEFDRSAMDGYALHAQETVGAGEYHPVSFRVLGESLPGRPFSGTVEPGTAVRTMTGAPIPEGADAVVPAEFASERDGTVEVTAAVAVDKHIGRCGEDIRVGATVLPAGRRLRPQDVAVAASLGTPDLEVLKRPQVRIVITGNELVIPGHQKGRHQIYDANSYLLRGLITRDGGDLESIRRCEDDRRSIQAAFAEKGADVILVSGGTSVGQEDFVPGLVQELGELAIHGIAMRPSSPTGLGKIDGGLVCLLPGNPVSCLCAYDFFAGRAIRRLAGRSSDWPYRSLTAPLRRKVASAIGRVDYCRVKVSAEGVEPLAISGASILSSTTRADGFLIVDAESEGASPGTDVQVYLYDHEDRRPPDSKVLGT